jgi:hypothetical protein
VPFCGQRGGGTLRGVASGLRIAGVALWLGAGILGCSSDDATDQGVTPVSAVKPAASKAKLKQLLGTVLVKRAAGDDWIAAGDQMELFENDKVRTAAGASAVLEFSNGTFVTLGEDALIAIAETRPRPGADRTDVTVLKGRLDADLDDAATKSLSVSTPAATVRAGREIVFQ